MTYLLNLDLVPFCFFTPGLQLTLNHDSPAVPGARIACGILTCEENTDDLVSSTSGSDQTGSSVSLKSISNMFVFKRASTRPGADKGNEREFLIASVTSQEPSLTRVENGIKVGGLLEAGRATLRVELFKESDCQAEFTCKVHGLDTLGREVVSTASLLQQRGQTQNQVDEGISMPASAMSLQLLASIQQMISQSLKGLDEKIEQMQKDLSDQSGLKDKVEDLRQDLNDRSYTFERRIEDRLLLFENRVEDKIDNNNNLNKLIQLDVKLSTELAQFRSEVKADILGSLDNLREQVQNEQREAMSVVSESFEKTLNSTYDLLVSGDGDFGVLKSKGQTNLLTIRNETETIREMLMSGDSLTRQIWHDVKDLGPSIINCTTKAQCKSDSGINKTDLHSSIMDILTPKFCRKGMGFALTHNTRPYMMINPGQTTPGSIDFPHVCDTVTDGGGWIVIQRRETGNTDFYRNWTDYKQGFGSLDDDFWIGNDRLHAITGSGPYELRVDLKYKGMSAFAHYDQFYVADESDKYKLKVGQYDGTAGDSLTYHSGHRFSSIDRDHDGWDKNCAVDHGGGWWFNNCDVSNLNGKWGASPEDGVEWETIAASDSVSYAEMKIRRV